MEKAITDLSKKIPTTDILEQINDLQRQLLDERQKPAVKEIVEPTDYATIKAENADLGKKVKALSEEIKQQREKFEKDRATFETSLSKNMDAQIRVKEQMLDDLRKEMDARYAKLDEINRANGMILPAKELAKRIERNLEDIAAGLEEFFDELGSHDVPKESAPTLRKLADMMMDGAEMFDAILQRKEKTIIEVN